jgi:hypothetical protein
MEFPVNMFAKFALPGLLFLLTLGFGFWLSKTGKPYNGILFNIHKLLALGTVIVLVIQFSKDLPNAASLALIIVLLVVAALCVITLFASGALMSMGKLDYALTLTIHRIAPVALIIALGWVAYLL